MQRCFLVSGVVIFSILQGQACQSLDKSGQEPICTSRFDYDFKMMKTVVDIVKENEELRRDLAALRARVDQHEDVLQTTSSAMRSFDNNVNDINHTLQSSSAQLDSNINAVNQKLDSNINAVNQKLDSNINAVNQTLGTLISDINATVLQISRTDKTTVGFTARYKKDYVNGKLRFSNIVTRVGEGYDENTGVFTAPVSGLYLVSATLQLEIEGNIYCQIYRNGGSPAVEVEIIGKGHEPGSQTILLELNKEDTAYIGGCHNHHKIGDESTFTVVLLRATR